MDTYIYTAVFIVVMTHSVITKIKKYLGATSKVINVKNYNWMSMNEDFTIYLLILNNNDIWKVKADIWGYIGLELFQVLS